MAGSAYAAYPPPLPAPPRRAPSTSGAGVITLVVVVVVAVAGFLVYYTRVLGKPLASLFGGGTSDAPTPAVAPVAPPNPPPTAAQQKTQMAICEAKRMQHATCMLDPASNAVYGKCDPGYYGQNCLSACPTGGNKATKYTPGFESGSSDAASCVCEGHFMNSDPQGGCEIGSALSDAHCEAGWHGAKCDRTGELKSCAHGTQDATTGECVCPSGWVGSLCQFPSDYCTSMDKGATISGDSCVCSAGYEGPRCRTKVPTECKNGGTLSADGKSCACVAPWAGFECQHKLGTCMANSGVGCVPDGQTCMGTFGSGCDHCKIRKAKNDHPYVGCCSDNYTGCGGSQAAECVDKNTYPCVTASGSLGVHMMSGGVKMTPKEMATYAP